MSLFRTTWISISLAVIISTAGAQTGPHVQVSTERGSFAVILDSAQAPHTVTNFLRYVDGGFYQGGSFYRTVTPSNQPSNNVKIEVIQGGIAPERRGEAFSPIRLETTDETGIRHLNGTISMARSSPHTATWSFFICIGDQPELDFGGARNPDGQGFAAFGKVIDGMDVVRKIQQSAAEGQSLTPPILIRSITRASFVPDSLRR